MVFVKMINLTAAGLVSSVTGKKSEVILSRMESERSMMSDERAIGIADGCIYIVSASVTLGIGAMI